MLPWLHHEKDKSTIAELQAEQGRPWGSDTISEAYNTVLWRSSPLRLVLPVAQIFHGARWCFHLEFTGLTVLTDDCTNAAADKDLTQALAKFDRNTTEIANKEN
jgi:hypothetical protein